jgi:cysteine-rich repeat protein
MYRTNHAPTPTTFQLPTVLLATLTACGPGIPNDGADSSSTASSTTGATDFPSSSSPAITDPSTGHYDASTANPSSSEGPGGTGETGESSSAGDDTISATTSPIPVCGDGVVEGDETCDDMNDIPDDGCNNVCARDSVVFMTSEHYTGDVNGLAGADQRCRMLAAIAGLRRFETFRAWLSTAEESAADRLLHSRGRYVLVNGLVVAENWDELVSGTLLAPIDVDENSQTHGDYFAWTGTLADGQPAFDAGFCNGWTVNTDVTGGGAGVTLHVDATWSFAHQEGCQVSNHIYCIEQ